MEVYSKELHVTLHQTMYNATTIDSKTLLITETIAIGLNLRIPQPSGKHPESKESWKSFFVLERAHVLIYWGAKQESCRILRLSSVECVEQIIVFSLNFKIGGLLLELKWSWLF